jgi:RNA ligase
MNPFQQKLYADLVALTKANEAFYFQDFELDGHTYRIFNYRLASYTDFQLPGALECRGVMFEIVTTHVTPDRKVEDAVRLAALPMEKFFNLNENPMTMNLDLSKVVAIEEKVDGSLMSTYLHNGVLRLKSKGSLFSDQALAAMKWLDIHPSFKWLLKTAAKLGTTVNLEWCSPEHRIVLGYMEPTLKVLNIRDNVNGSYYTLPAVWEAYAVKRIESDDPVAFVASIPSMQDVEGFVLVLDNGQRVKVKCDWYLSLHHAKDSVNNPRRLFEAILDEGIDDLRSLFYADPLAMKTIDEMQVKVDHIYNEMVKLVEDYYVANHDLSKKDYAIKGQQELPRLYFGLAMNKYVGKAMNYKEFLKGKWKDLGLKDTSMEKTDE